MKNIWKSKWKMFVISVVSASVICVNLPVFAEQEVTNIAFGITPTQSFSSSTTGTLSTVTDGIKGEGSGGTSWFIRADYHYSQNPALIFDLGASATVSSFVVIGSTRYTNPGSDNSYALAKNYDILYSDNGNDWTTAATVSDNVNYENTTEIPEITARYWKIFVKFQSKTSGERAKICEIEIYGTKTELPPPTEPPTVGMTGERVEIDEGETVRVSAIAFSEISTIKTVAFYEGTTKLADGVLENGEWVATLAGLTPGEHMISAKAVDEEGGEAFSDSMRVRVHGDEYSNIALGKIVNADHGNTSDSYPQALVDGITDQGSGVYKWIANAANANGAYAEIDLASGFDNEFIIDKITVMSAYADVSTTDILKDFTLSYYAQDKWITAAQVTGAGSVYSYSFENPVVTTKVKLTSNMSDAFRVREVEVEGKLYRKPVLVVVSPESNPANVFENKFQMKLSATNLDSAFSRAEVSLNGVFKEASVSIDNSIYTITVDGLSDGENVIFARLYDRYDRYSDSEAVTVLYISGEQFERDFKNCITIQDIGNLIQNNQELLQFTANNYTDLSIYGDIYAAMLANKNNISTITEFVDAFNVGLTLKDLNQASSDEFMNIVREKFDSVKLDEYDTLDAEIQKAVCTRMAAENITDVNQIQTMIDMHIALQSIKYAVWSNLENVIDRYQARLNLPAYGSYSKLSSADKITANKYIASKKSDDRMNSTEGLSDILSQAVRAAQEETTGGGSSFSGRKTTSVGSIEISNDLALDTQSAEPASPYDDVDKNHSAWAAIIYLNKAGVMQGDGNGSFDPERKLTREEMAKIIVSAFFEMDENAQTTFTDVNKTDWFYPYVANGQQLGIIEGIDDTLFGSREQVTREQMAVLCYRAAVKAGKTFVDDVESNVASDEEFISSWAFYPITVLRKQGFFADEMIRPTEFASRADAAQLLYEIMLMEEKA